MAAGCVGERVKGIEGEKGKKEKKTLFSGQQAFDLQTRQTEVGEKMVMVMV